MQTIYFDIETGPLPENELAALLPPFDPAEVKTGNLKDPEKIAAKLAEAEANHRREFIDRAALDPLTGRVVAIGLLIASPHPSPFPSAEREKEAGSESQPHHEFKIIGHDDEAATLKEFWQVCQGDMGRINEMIGFNSNQFDLPFLIRRSWKHRVPVPHGIRRGRYWSEQMIDLRDLWQLGDRQARGSLDAVAKHLGVGSKNGDGKDFAKLWETDREKAIEYLRNDLQLTARVAEALGVVGA
jgi:DNA polymerase elongation subunit (family B)